MTQLNPLLYSIVNIFTESSILTEFELQEKARIQALLGSHHDAILKVFIHDITNTPEDIYQTLVTITLLLLRRYKPQASFATYITKQLRWRLVDHIRKITKTKVNIKQHVILLSDYQYEYYLSKYPYILTDWEKLLCWYVTYGMSIRDIETLTGVSKSQIHRELQSIRSRVNEELD